MIAKFTKQKRKKNQQIISNFLLFLIILIFICVLAISNFKIFQKKRELLKKIEDLKKELQVLKEKNEILKTAIFQTQKNDYWEERIRQEGYFREGEVPILILPPQKESKETENKLTPKSLFEKIKNFWQK